MSSWRRFDRYAGNPDIVAHAISQPLSEALKQPVAVSTPGTNGPADADRVAESPAESDALMPTAQGARVCMLARPEFTAFLEGEGVKWAAVVAQRGAKLEG